MRKRKNCVIDVTYAGHTQTAITTTVGNACRMVFANLIRTGRIKRQPRYDRDNKEGGLFAGVSVEVRDRQIHSLGKVESFADLTKRACARAGLPWIPPRSARS